MKSDVEKKLQPDNGLPQISVKPVKMFMQRSLTKQDLNLGQLEGCIKEEYKKRRMFSRNKGVFLFFFYTKSCFSHPC